jgi:O-antigen ligase
MKMDGSIAREDPLKFPASGARERVARLLGSFVFYSLLLLIALVAVPYGTAQPWWQALFECTVFGLAALWIIEGLLSGSWRFSEYSLLWPLVALVAFALWQTVPLNGGDAPPGGVGGVWEAVSADPTGTRRWASKMAALILTGAMLLRYASNERRWRALVYLVIGVAAASAVFGLLRQMTQHEIGFVLPHLKPGFGYAQFINRNHYAFLMEMALGLVLGLAVSESGRRERLVICLGLAVLLGGTLVLTYSRGGLFSFVCQIILAALLFFTVRRVRDATASRSHAIRWMKRLEDSRVVRALLIICLIVVVSVGIVWVGGDPLVGSLEAIPAEVGAPAEGIRWAVRRKEIWPATWHLIKDHWVTGVGFGGYWMAITAYHQGSGEKMPQEAHNDYLEFLASGGLVGVALGGWFIYAFYRRIRLRLRSTESTGRAMSFGALVGLSGVAVHSLVDFGLHITINAVVFITLLVIATAANASTEGTDSALK